MSNLVRMLKACFIAFLTNAFLIEIWITSSSIFGHGVSLRARYLAKFLLTVFQILLCNEVFLLTQFLPLLLDCSAEVILKQSNHTAKCSCRNKRHVMDSLIISHHISLHISNLISVGFTNVLALSYDALLIPRQTETP